MLIAYFTLIILYETYHINGYFSLFIASLNKLQKTFLNST